MSVRQCVPLDSLDESSEGCRIQARVVTIWECNNSERFLQTIGLNLKLLDVEEYCVEAYIPPRTVKKFKSVLEEGQTYEICNFSVSKYSVDFKLRACNKPIYILFREDTKVLAGDKDCQLIPKNIFDFLMLKDVRQCKGYNNRLLDIVGLIGFIEPLSISTNDHGIEEKCIEFGITDGIHPSSRFVVNCQSEIVEHLTNRLFSIADTHSNKGRKVHTISEIISRENLNPEENVYIQGKIVSISENDSWYFLQCNQCGGEVLDNLAKWRCNYCKIKIPMPDKRFSVNAYVCDDTATFKIRFNDQQVQNFIKRGFFDLEMEYGLEDIFKVLQIEFVGKKLLLRINTSCTTITDGAPVYTVSSIQDET
nr:PREDICTED: uncharacterized protein LOC108192654 [Daucus carota subsp. sativus]